MAIIELDKSNFSDTVLGGGDILVDFFAAWCGPCRTLSRVIDEIAENGVRVGKLDIDKNPELARKWGVASVPTLIWFKDGSPTATSVGVKSKSAIMKMISQ